MRQNKVTYLSGLNGIRAIAALAVLLSHVNLSLPSFEIQDYSLFGFKNGKHLAWNLGEQGVTMFFVLSGFLITYLLLLEFDKKKSIQIKSFYLRRILRIWPLYFFYLFLSIAFVYFLTYEFPTLGQLTLYTFLLANVPFVIGPVLTACHHLWSIAVEEQFYLFWPLFFLKKINLKLIMIVLISSFGLCRMLLWYFYPFTTLTLFFTVNRFDCMMIGGLFAVLLSENHPIIKVCTAIGIQVAAWFILFLHFFNFEVINSVVSFSFISFATGIIICGQILSQRKFINLENRFMNMVGKYSFGIYVYHPLVLFVLIQTKIFLEIENQMLRVILLFCFIIAITFLVSFLSYKFLEKPFLNRKHKFSVIKSSNTPVSSKTL